MTKKQKRWLALGGAALAVGLLAWAFWPRTFAQTVGEGYDPSQIWEMQVTLNDVADPDRSRAVVLSAGDPALEEALSILNSQRYRPIYHWGAITGKSVPLDYYITGSLCLKRKGTAILPPSSISAEIGRRCCPGWAERTEATG